MSLDVILGTEKVEIVLGGVTYEASRLKLGDFAEFRAWAGQKKLASFMKAASESGLDPALFSKTVETLLDGGGTKIRRSDDGQPVLGPDGQVIVESDPVVNAMGTEEGMRKILTLSIRHKHPDFDSALLADLDIDELGKVADVITRISTPSGVDEGGEKVNPPQGKDSDS